MNLVTCHQFLLEFMFHLGFAFWFEVKILFIFENGGVLPR